MLESFLQLSAYSYKIQDKTFKKSQNVDALWRLPRPKKDAVIPDKRFFFALGQMEFPLTATEVAIAKKVQYAIFHEWPVQVSEEFSSLVSRKTELITLRGSIIRGCLTAISQSLQAYLLKQLQSLHETMTRIKMIA